MNPVVIGISDCYAAGNTFAHGRRMKSSFLKKLGFSDAYHCPIPLSEWSYLLNV